MNSLNLKLYESKTPIARCNFDNPHNTTQQIAANGAVSPPMFTVPLSLSSKDEIKKKR